MTKYSNELKAKVVSEYLKGGIGYRELSVRYGIPSRANIRTWVNQARTHGIESLKVKHNKATYSQTFKITVVEYVHTHQVSRVQAAAHFGISPSQVNSWIRIVKDQGVTGLRAQRKGRPPMGKHKQIKPIKKLEPTQERVGIIRAFGTKPDLILMDEPFSALDPVSREQLQDLTLSIHQHFNNTILFITHDMNEALKMGQQIGVVKDGHIIQLDTPDNLVRHPSNDYVKTLFNGSEAHKIENVYIRRLVLAGYGRKTPFKKLPVTSVEGDRTLGDCYQLLAQNQQLAVRMDSQVIGYLNSESVLNFLATKATNN